MTAVLSLLVANAFDLTSIATLGSAGFLLIFAAVNAANAWRAKDTHSVRWFAVMGAIASFISFASLIWQTARTSDKHLGVLVAMVGHALPL